jgi:TonB-linked SusC/RagA family outer membrane protein
MKKNFTRQSDPFLRNKLCSVFRGGCFLLTLVLLTVFCAPAFAQQKQVTGIVVDAKGEPMPGVSVIVKGTQIGGPTKLDGSFSIKVPNSNAILVVSFIGYLTQEIQVGNNVAIKVTLKESQSALNEVVVVGYGAVRKPDLTGAVGVVKMADFEKAPVVSGDQALEGRIAGVQVISPDGQPGSVADIVIRGTGSITQSSGPLYVIDGFPQENSAFSTLNPGDIESMTVLKDASSTAIYGARGSNGVVIITTKRGQTGAPKVSFNSYFGTQQMMKKLQLLNAYDFVRLQNDISSSYARAVYFANGRTLDFYRNAETIDWQDKLFRVAPFANYNLSASGKTNNTNYFVSGNYVNQDGLLINSGFQRWQGRMSLDQKLNDNLTFGLVANYSATKAYGNNTSTQSQGIGPGTQNNVQFNMMQAIWSYRPINSSGDLNALETTFQDDEAGDRDLDRLNPYLLALNTVNNVYSNALQSNAYAEVKFAKYFKIRSTAGVNYNSGSAEYFNNTFTRGGSPLTNQGATNGMSGGVNGSSGYSILNENTLSYTRQINKNNYIDALVAFTDQYTEAKTTAFQSIQVPNERLGVSGLDEGTPFSNAYAEGENTQISYLGRINYNYKGKYYLTASMRADASSKFYDGHKWGYFPSAAVKWKILEEPFMKNIKGISTADLRISYGTSGNNRVDNYAYSAPIVLSGSGTGTRYSFNNNIITGAVPTKMFNPDLRWETSKMLDIGLETGFLKDRISVEVDYYDKRTSDLLLNSNIPPSLGYSLALENIGDLQNTGLEITLNTVNIRKKNFSWSSSFNISFNQNKVLALSRNQQTRTEFSASTTFSSDFANQPLYVARVGQPIAAFYGYVYDGLYRLADFDAVVSGSATTYRLKGTVPYFTNATTPQPGDVKFKDLNGDGIIDANDYAVIGNPYPKNYGGFTNDFTYKNFDLSVFFQWSYGNQEFNGNRVTLEGQSTGDTRGLGLNMLATYADYWTPTNDGASMPRPLVIAFGQRSFSSRYIEDASYLRLKTVSLGYNIPKSLLSKIRVSNARIYASGQNLWTWTKYTGPDPDVSTKNSPTTPGFDFSAYPRARVIVFGANLSF